MKQLPIDFAFQSFQFAFSTFKIKWKELSIAGWLLYLAPVILHRILPVFGFVLAPILYYFLILNFHKVYRQILTHQTLTYREYLWLFFDKVQMRKAAQLSLFAAVILTVPLFLFYELMMVFRSFPIFLILLIPFILFIFVFAVAIQNVLIRSFESNLDPQLWKQMIPDFMKSNWKPLAYVLPVSLGFAILAAVPFGLGFFVFVPIAFTIPFQIYQKTS